MRDAPHESFGEIMAGIGFLLILSAGFGWWLALP